MAEQNKQTGILGAIVVSAIIFAVAVMAFGCKKNSSEQTDAEHQHREPPAAEHKPDEHVSDVPATGTTEEPAKTDSKPPVSPKVSLEEVIINAKGWGPVHVPWYDKTAPDFTLTDIAGKQHKLSDYRGKNVMLVFWATWCRPCIVEVPHLIALQQIMGKDNLAILAVSYISSINTAEMIKTFVGRNERINYTVLAANTGSMPTPFSDIDYLPSSFFIKADGKIKLATSGVLSLADMKAILQAE